MKFLTEELTARDQQDYVMCEDQGLVLVWTVDLRFIYLFVCLNVYVKWYFVLSTTHAKLVDCVTAIK